MEFLRVVEEELRGLAAEARRRHPVVQEAAERCAGPLPPPLLRPVALHRLHRRVALLY